MIKQYLLLLKPGYVISNSLMALAGFIIGSRGGFSILHLIFTMLAIFLGLITVCILNNVIDKDIDSNMIRTQKRPIVTGAISRKKAATLGIVIGVISVILFIIFTNIITLIAGGVGLFVYLVLYSIAKRKTSWSTIIGSVPGAIVPLAGYTAAVNRIDTTAILLFFILFFWQLPHFYAIAIYRCKEYAAAGLPVLSVAKGISATKIQMLIFVVCFAVVAMALALVGDIGLLYLFVLTILSILWVVYGVKGYFMKDVNKWAKQMFGISLIINLAISLVSILSIIVGSLG